MIVKRILNTIAKAYKLDKADVYKAYLEGNDAIDDIIKYCERARDERKQNQSSSKERKD